MTERKLTRSISLNVATQKRGDCFAHACARVILKAFRTLYPEQLNFKRPESDGKICLSFYDDPLKFFNCDEKSFMESATFMMGLSTHTKCSMITVKELDVCDETEKLNLLLYMLFWSMIVKKFGCHGGKPIFALQYVIYDILYTTSDVTFNTDVIIQSCFFDPELCKIIRDFFERIRITHMLQPTILAFNPLSSSNYPVFVCNEPTILIDPLDPIKQCSLDDTPYYRYIELAEGYYPNFNILFYDTIQYNIDHGFYAVLSAPGEFYVWKTMNPDSMLTDSVSEFGTVHSVTIVDYDYTDMSNKIIFIKNSWGDPKLIPIYESELFILCKSSPITMSGFDVHVFEGKPTKHVSDEPFFSFVLPPNNAIELFPLYLKDSNQERRMYTSKHYNFVKKHVCMLKEEERHKQSLERKQKLNDLEGIEMISLKTKRGGKRKKRKTKKIKYN